MRPHPASDHVFKGLAHFGPQGRPTAFRSDLTKVKERRWAFPHLADMFTAIRSFVICVCLVLVSAHGAITHATTTNADSVVRMVICADGEARTVSLDMNGDPVTPDGPCVQCRYCLGAADLAVLAACPAVSRVACDGQLPSWTSLDQIHVAGSPPRPMTRAPPCPAVGVHAATARNLPQARARVGSPPRQEPR